MDTRRPHQCADGMPCNRIPNGSDFGRVCDVCMVEHQHKVEQEIARRSDSQAEALRMVAIMRENVQIFKGVLAELGCCDVPM